MTTFEKKDTTPERDTSESFCHLLSHFAITKLQIWGQIIMFCECTASTVKCLVFLHFPQIIYNLTTTNYQSTRQRQRPNSHQVDEEIVEHGGDAVDHDGTGEDRPDVASDLFEWVDGFIAHDVMEAREHAHVPVAIVRLLALSCRQSVPLSPVTCLLLLFYLAHVLSGTMINWHRRIVKWCGAINSDWIQTIVCTLVILHIFKIVQFTAMCREIEKEWLKCCFILKRNWTCIFPKPFQKPNRFLFLQMVHPLTSHTESTKYFIKLWKFKKPFIITDN